MGNVSVTVDLIIFAGRKRVILFVLGTYIESCSQYEYDSFGYIEEILLGLP